MPEAVEGTPARKRNLVRLSFVLGLVIVLSMALYVTSYVSLSLGGRFEPAGIGLNGVKYYAWAPRGFVTDFKWHRKPMQFYYPLYILDCRCWHKYADAWTGKYPINEVATKDIGKVYRAWREPEPGP